MNSTPFYNVKTANGLDLSDYITQFSFEDCVQEDDMLEITLQGFDFIEHIDSGKLASGLGISFTFGFTGAGSIVSAAHVAIITDIEPSYALNTLTIRALDKGIVLKKSENIIVWENKTATDIVREIATKYKMEAVIEETTIVYDAMPQSGDNDFQFLKYLASIEQGGNYIFYVKNETLYFLTRGTDTDSILTYSYPDNNIIEFKPQLSDILANSEGTEVQSSTYSLSEQASKEVKVNADLEEADTKLGKYVNEAFSGVYSENIKKKLVTIESEQIKTVNLLNSVEKEQSLKVLTADLTTYGNPTLVSDAVLTMSGMLLKRDLGNWYINKVRHDIGSSGYITSLSLEKNATAQNIVEVDNASVKLTTNKINKSKGKTTVEEEKVVVVRYDWQNKRVEYVRRKGVLVPK